MLEKQFTKGEFQRRFPQASTARAQAYALFEKLSLPSVKSEEWRYTDLNLYDWSACAQLTDVKLRTKKEHVIVEKQPVVFNEEPQDKLQAFTQAFGEELRLSVDAKERARLESHVHLQGSGALVEEVRIGKHAVMDFFEVYTSDEPCALFGQKTVFQVEPNAVLNYYSVQRFSEQALAFMEKEFHLGSGAEVNVVHVDAGAMLARTVVDQHFDGHAARAPKQQAAFLGSNRQHFDLTTRAWHHASNTQSDILVRGALKSNSSSVYRGVIRIDKTAFRTDSYLQDRVVHLNKGVVSNSIPSLFIENNDVKASHGATISKVNPENLFYLQSRGLSRHKAEKLVVDGFLEEIINTIPHDSIQENIREDFEKKLG